MSNGEMITGLPPAPLVSVYGTIFQSSGSSLSYSQTSNSVTISPQLGTPVTIPAATDSLAGMLDAARATVIDGLQPVASSGSYTDLQNTPDRHAILPLIIDGGGQPIVAGMTRFITVPFAATITGWAVMADVAGSISIDIWKTPFASFPPTLANSITGGNPLALVGAASAQISVLTGWTTAINAGDVLGFHVTSSATVTAVTAQLTVTH